MNRSPRDSSPQGQALALAALLERSGWWEWFDERTLDRGITYAAEGRVADGWQVLELGGDYGLNGSVAGSGRNEYRVHVFVDGSSEQLIATCSCPVGRNCKHGVALLEAFTAAMDVDPEDAAVGSGAGPRDRFEREWQRAIDALERLKGSRRLPEVDGDRVLGLFLDEEPDAPLPGLRVAAVWLRRSRTRKSDRLVSPEPVKRLEDTLWPAPIGGWPVELEECLAILLSGRPAHVRATALRWVSIHNRFQARALARLLRSEDCPVLFLDRQTGPRLVPGPTLALRTRWRSEPSGVQRLVPVVEGPEGPRDDCHLVQVGESLWYIDEPAGETGPVEGSPELVAWANNAPAVPPEHLAWAAAKLQGPAGRMPGLEVPEPAEVVELAATAPTLVLRLELLPLRPPRPSFAVPVYGAARPAFRYGDVVVENAGEDRPYVDRDDRLLIVTRDRAAEAALLQALPDELIAFDELLVHAAPEIRRAFGELRLLRLGRELPEDPGDWLGKIAEPQDWWRVLPRLRRRGIEIELAEDFPDEPERLAPDAWHAEIHPSDAGWFDLALDVEVDGTRIHLLPLLRAMLDDPRFPLEPPEDEPEDACWEIELDDDRLLALPLARLRPLITPILDWVDRDLDDDTLRLPGPAALDLDVTPAWRGPGRRQVRALARTLGKAPERIPAPKGLVGTLRDYQAEGVAWLRRTALLGTGGILADDMGLGKTLQVLAHVLDERERRRTIDPVLVVCPTSLVANWCSEAGRFCPELRVLHLQLPRAQRAARLKELGSHDLVVTTYALLVRDLEALAGHRFSLLVLDEAQAVKNANSQTAVAARQVDAERRLAITGTPIENHLGELWAQLDLVAPGFLGSRERFGELFRAPVERRGESEPLHRLRRRIAPLLLRRTRDQVLDELPEKTETVRAVELSGQQRELYESLRLAQHKRVREAVEQRGLARSGIVVLDALLKLRQACCDPRLVKLASAKRVKGSAKLAELRSLLATLLDEGRRVLVFSQFTEMLELIAEALEKDRVAFETLTGQVPGRERKARIERFQQGEVPVFLISLKAGGTGLNLTAADTVIHYDPWWNPAIEAQATGRAHRMGQKRPVHVYRLVASGTVEERIAELQARKAELAEALLAPEGAGGKGLALDEGQLEALFAPVGAT